MKHRFFPSLLSLLLAGVLFNTSSLVLAQGSWSGVSYTGNPLSRDEGSFVQAGNKFYLIGGRGSNRGVQEFNYQTNEWINRTAVPLEMHHFQLVAIDNLIYAVGGFTGTYPLETPVAHVYIYDPLSSVWHAGPSIPANRLRGSAGVVVHNNEIYVVSGLRVGHRRGWVPWTDKYNPATNTWTQLPDAPRARDHFAAVIANNRIYAIAGRQSCDSCAAGVYGNTIAEIDYFDLGANSWNSLPAAQNIPIQRANAMAAALGNQIIVAGGESNAQNGAFSIAHVLDATSNQWASPLPNMPVGRQGTQMISSGGGLWMAAGNNLRGSSAISPANPFFLMRFDPTGSATTPTGSAIVQSNLAASAPSVSFGNVTTGTTAIQQIAFSNTLGNQALILNGITQSGSNIFSVVSPYAFPFVLPPGASLTLNVQAAPTATGTYSGTFSIQQGNGTNSYNSSISLSAQGVVPPPNNLSYVLSGASCSGVTVGSAVLKTITLSAPQNINISSIVLSGSTAFGIASNPLPTAVFPPQTVSFDVNFTPPVPGNYAVSVIITHSGANSPLSVPISCSAVAAGPCNLLSGWANQVIGGPSPLGSTCHNNGLYTLEVGGNNIGGTWDQFRFTYLPLSGDGEIVARLSYLSNVGPNTKAGLMFRESFGTNSRNAFLGLSGPGNRLFQVRPTDGSITNISSNGTATTPYWLKLRRIGNFFEGYVSSDGINYTLLGSGSASNLSGTLYVGLALTSGVPGTAAVATFDNVSVNNVILALPGVRWGDFQAEIQGDKTVLNWVTVDQGDGYSFSIERSSDGINFSDIGEVPSGGESDLPQSFQAEDPSPEPGRNLYRIRHNGIDGEKFHSNSVEVYYSPVRLSLYPNPVKEGSQVNLSWTQASRGTARISVHNAMGKAVFFQQLNFENGPNEITLSTTGWAAGMYVVQLNDGTSIRRQQVVVY